VAASANVPITGGIVGESPFHIQGTPAVPPAERPLTTLRMVTPDYFRTLGIPLLRGRDFNMDDRRESARVFIVNQAFADVFLRGGDPLAATISIGSNNPPITGRIIAVVGNVREDSLRGHVEPTAFFTYSQIATSTDMIVFVNADNVLGLTQAAVQAIHDINKNVPVYEIRLLESVFGESIARDRLNAVVSGAFALSALLLAAFGIYGLVSFQVAERTREIGIRMALGGRSQEVLRMVLGQSMRLVIPGLVVGLAAALALTHFIESLLYGIPPRDPSTFAGVIVLILGVSVLAALLPARRAIRVDPLITLRGE
jgi:predicted permease